MISFDKEVEVGCAFFKRIFLSVVEGHLTMSEYKGPQFWNSGWALVRRIDEIHIQNRRRALSASSAWSDFHNCKPIAQTKRKCTSLKDKSESDYCVL